MRRRATAPSLKQLVQAVTATLLVAVCPVAIVWWLRVSGTVPSTVLGVVLGMSLSLCASRVGRVLWEKRPGSEDLLFSELMMWGFLHRWHTQRQLASARDMVGPVSRTQKLIGGLSSNEQARLLERLVSGMETRDPYLHGHSRRVARHSWMIAKRMGLPRAEVARIRVAAAIHDVGKIDTPKEILHKPGALTVEEYEVIKKHPSDGARMAAGLRDAELTSMVRHHHERLDGTGYPSGLSAEEIPLGARIIAVADTFDAITAARPYRPASPHKIAIDILRNETGTQLDPAVVRAFCSHYAGLRSLALWGSFVSLLDRLTSWLGGGAASLGSTAKVVGVAALVGAATTTPPTLALPVVEPHPIRGHRASVVAPPAYTGDSTPVGAVVSMGPATPRTLGVGKGLGVPLAHRGAAGPRPASSSPGGVGGARPSGAEPGKVKGTPPGKVESEAPGKVKGTPPGKVKATPPGKVKGTPPGKVKATPPGKVKSEPSGKVNSEHPGKSEPPGKSEHSGKSEHPGKSEA
jgi:hypothetical protein